MQALRIQSELTTLRVDSIGVDAPMLGRRMLAAARVAAAMHMGQVTESVRTAMSPVKPDSEKISDFSNFGGAS